MKMEEQKEILQLQLLEQNLQNLALQKQSFQLEIAETENAIRELKKLKDEEVFKIVSNLMIKAEKNEVIPELEKKQEILNLRVKAIEKQEEELRQKLFKLREELVKKLKK